MTNNPKVNNLVQSRCEVRGAKGKGRPDNLLARLNNKYGPQIYYQACYYFLLTTEYLITIYYGNIKSESERRNQIHSYALKKIFKSPAYSLHMTCQGFI